MMGAGISDDDEDEEEWEDQENDVFYADEDGKDNGDNISYRNKMVCSYLSVYSFIFVSLKNYNSCFF